MTKVIKYCGLLISLLWLNILLVGPVSYAQQTAPYIIAPEVTTFFNIDKTGPYDKLFQEFEHRGIISGYEVSSPLRARRNFLRDKNNCYSPTDESILNIIGMKKEDAVISSHFNEASGILIFKNNHPALTDDAILANTTIGVVGLPANSNYGMGGYDFKKIIAPDYNKLAELYDRGRFEGIYVFLPNARLYEGTNKLLNNNKSFQRKIWDGYNAITCHIENKENVAKINKAIHEMKESGKLKEILGELYYFN